MYQWFRVCVTNSLFYFSGVSSKEKQTVSHQLSSVLASSLSPVSKFN